MNKLIPDQGISETLFYGDLVIYSTELLETLILVIFLKRLSNVIKKLDITWISCGSLYT